MATTAGVGHFYPLIPLAWAAEAAGHEVRLAAPPALAGAVAGRGLTHVPLPDLGERHQARVIAAARAMSVPATPEQERVFVRENFGWAKTDATLQAMRDAVRAWRPDLILHEAFEWSSLLAAEEAGVAHATVAMGLRDMIERWTPSVAAGAADVAGRPAGVTASASPVLTAPFLTMVPPLLDTAPGTEPARLLRYRTVDMHAGAAATSLSGDGPLVWVTFGTEAWRVPGALDPVIPALAEAAAALPDVRFLLTTGNPGLAPAGLPGNVIVESYVPQEQALAACAAVVHHCGFNTTMAAVAHGRPSVALPLFSADQFANAARLDEIGAAVRPPGPDGEALRSAILGALRDERVADMARALAGDVEAMPPASAALTALVN